MSPWPPMLGQRRGWGRPLLQGFQHPLHPCPHIVRQVIDILPAGDSPPITTGQRPATLQLHVHYLRPPTDWVDQILDIPFDSIEHATRATLDWRQDLPRAARNLQHKLEVALRRKEIPPLLVEASPFVRGGVIETIRHHVLAGQRTAEADMRQWLYIQMRFGARGLQAGEGEFLAWLAPQIWPNLQAHSDHLRGASAPRLLFEELARAQNAPPRVLILNNWERLLFYLAHGRELWQPLDAIFPYLVHWAREQETGLVLGGTFLSEQITRRRWPDLSQDFIFVRADQVSLRDTHLQGELSQAMQQLIAERELQDALTRLSPQVTIDDLIELCGGFLHFLDYVCLEALDALAKEPEEIVSDWEHHLVNYARQINFFNSLWMWQDFFDRVAITLIAHGELPLQEAAWATAGLVLSRDYHARRPGGQASRRPTLTTGQRLLPADVTKIRSSQYYRSEDAWVRGFRLNQPVATPEEKLFRQLLQAGGGEARLERLVEFGILRRERVTRLGDFYVINVPLYGHWLRQSGIWEHMRRAALGGQNSWYPSRLAQDQRPDVPTRQLLFAERIPGMAHRDLETADLPAIDRQLDRDTQRLFLNLYGLQDRGPISAADRWQALVQLAQGVAAWSAAGREGAREATPEAAQMLLESLVTLLNLEVVRPVTAPLLDGALVSFAYQDIILRKQVLLLFVSDGALQAKNETRFRSAARRFFDDYYRREARQSDEQDVDYRRLRERSVVLVLAMQNAVQLRQALPTGRGGPHFIVLDLPQITDIAVQTEPLQALIRLAFTSIGRHSFSPYKLHGSLSGGSPLFVGRKSELNQILQTLDADDHAILGSRRIGKTSLLHELHYRLHQGDYPQQMFTLLVRLRDSSDDREFFGEVRNALARATRHQELAERLPTDPAGDYTPLRDVIQTVYDRYKHPVIFLIDEIDGLYLWDRDNNRQDLFQFLRNMAQAQPRLCTFIMTGYRYIYMDRQQSGSVFNNFCSFHNFASIEPDGVQQLVSMLTELGLQLEDSDNLMRIVQDGTYAIPYYVQHTCDALLQRADRLNKNALGPEDAQAVLEQDIRQQLKAELWDDLLQISSPLHQHDRARSGEPAHIQNLKTKIVLLATMLDLYQHKFDKRYSYARHNTEPNFTAADVIANLQELASDLVPAVWPATVAEINRLLRPLTMTLALNPANVGHLAFQFPNNILPEVLYFYEERGEIDLLNELDSMLHQLSALLQNPHGRQQ